MVLRFRVIMIAIWYFFPNGASNIEPRFCSTYCVFGPRKVLFVVGNPDLGANQNLGVI